MSQDLQTRSSATLVFIILLKLLAAFGPLIGRNAAVITRAVPTPSQMLDTVVVTARTGDGLVSDTPLAGRVAVDLAPDLATEAVALIDPARDDADAQ